MSPVRTRPISSLFSGLLSGLAGLLAAAGMPSPAQAQTQPQSPNIVLLFADDFGWVDVSTGQTNLGNGSLFYQTPHLDQLAAEGLAFTAAYAQQNCAPTRAALLTGQYATRNNVYNVQSLNRANQPNQTLIIPPNVQSGDAIATSAFTAAEMLQSASYTTAHFGKFHITDTEGHITQQHGFDFNFGGGTTGNPGNYFASESGGVWTFSGRISTELDVYADPYTQAYIDDILTPYANGSNVQSQLGVRKHLTDATADAAEDFIESMAGGQSPFFMHVAFHAVHTPTQPRPDIQSKFAGIVSANGGNSPDPRHDSTAYAGLVEGMDMAIGRILDRLEDPNGDGSTADSITDSTIVMFYSDNGGHIGPTNNTPLRGRKGQLYEGGVRVPMVVRMPDAASPGAYVRGGQTTARMVHAVDFYRTLADWSGASLPAPGTHLVQGVSFADELSRKAPKPRARRSTTTSRATSIRGCGPRR